MPDRRNAQTFTSPDQKLRLGSLGREMGVDGGMRLLIWLLTHHQRWARGVAHSLVDWTRLLFPATASIEIMVSIGSGKFKGIDP